MSAQLCDVFVAFRLKLIRKTAENGVYSNDAQFSEGRGHKFESCRARQLQGTPRREFPHVSLICIKAGCETAASSAVRRKRLSRASALQTKRDMAHQRILPEVIRKYYRSDNSSQLYLMGCVS
jgi:hypothetical protein